MSKTMGDWDTIFVIDILYVLYLLYMLVNMYFSIIQ